MTRKKFYLFDIKENVRILFMKPIVLCLNKFTLINLFIPKIQKV